MELDSFPVSSSFSRRSLLLSAGGVALGLASGVGRANALSPTAKQLQSSGDIAAAAMAATSYLAARAAVTLGKDFSDVSKWVDPNNRNLVDFERNHFGRLGELGTRSSWNGIVERIWSEPTILDCSISAGEVRLTIRDWTEIQWRPAPVVVQRTAEEESLVRQFPEKYGINIPDYPLTDSGFGTRHDLTMVRTNQGWLVAKDGYKDSITVLGGASPDYSEVTSPSSSDLTMTPASGLLRAATPQVLAPNLLGLTFDWYSAYQYGLTWAKLRNPSYTDFSPNDCANFVSQCFTVGGYPTDGTWYKYSYAWINNIGLRNWLIASGRGFASNEGALGYADIVNYDWEPNGTYDHVAIVTGLPGPLVSCHSNDQRNVPYKSIAYPATTYLYTSTHIYY